MNDININEILEQDPIFESRITINDNFLVLKAAVENIGESLSLDVQNGTIDLTTSALGTIKAKGITTNKCIFPTSGIAKVSINELNDGKVAALIGAFDTVTASSIDVTSKVTAGGLKVTGVVELLGTTRLQKGITKKRESIGSFSSNYTKVVRNDDNVLAVAFSSSGHVLSLAPDTTATLLDGHEVTILNVGPGSFNIQSGNIVGYNSVELRAGGKSSAVLHYNSALSKWYIVSSNGLVLA